MLRYRTQAVSPDLLSMLNVATDGKVVSAETWTILWNTVLKCINNIDTYCVDIEATRIDWEKAKQDLRNTINTIKQGFVHYGEEPPTNEDILFWVRPCAKQTPSITPDVYYNPNSQNAQSGKAVAEALANYWPLDVEIQLELDGGDAAGELDIEYIIDSEVSDTSPNPVQNKAIKKYIDNIGGRVDELNEKLTDFIVEEDTIGNWTYRKWNSGIAECWGTFNLTLPDATFVKWEEGGVYNCDIPINEHYPFTFTTNPIVDIQMYIDSFPGYFASPTYDTQKVRYVKAFALTQRTLNPSVNAQVNISVKGTWD